MNDILMKGILMYRVIKGSSLSRATSHMNTSQCMFVTAYRSKYSSSENKSRNQQLESDIRSLGLGFIHVEGGFVENYSQEDERVVTEDALFVVNTCMNKDDFRDLASKLAKKYGQESVLVTTPVERNDGKVIKVVDVHAEYIDENGNVVDSFDNATFKDGQKYFTRLFNKELVFSSDDPSFEVDYDFPGNVMSKCQRHYSYVKKSSEIGLDTTTDTSRA